jgi:hypothetical protein
MHFQYVIPRFISFVFVLSSESFICFSFWLCPFICFLRVSTCGVVLSNSDSYFIFDGLIFLFCLKLLLSISLSLIYFEYFLLQFSRTVLLIWFLRFVDFSVVYFFFLSLVSFYFWFPSFRYDLCLPFFWFPQCCCFLSVFLVLCTLCVFMLVGSFWDPWDTVRCWPSLSLNLCICIWLYVPARF